MSNVTYKVKAIVALFQKVYPKQFAELTIVARTRYFIAAKTPAPVERMCTEAS